MSKIQLSPKGRVSFPDIFEPKAFNPNDKPKFALTLIFPAIDDMDPAQLELLKAMKAAANAAAMERFKVGLDGEYKGKKLASPFHKTDEKPEYYDPGQIYVKFSSFQKPGLVGPDKTPIDEASGDFYAGCWAHVSYDAYTYDHSGNRGVAFGLRNIQKTGDDESFSGSKTSPDDDFEDVSSEVPAASADEIPF